MLGPITNIASSMLSGPLQSIFGGVIGSLNNQSQALLGDGSVRLLDFVQNLGRLGSQGLQSGLQSPNSLPNPFQLPGNAFQNPTSSLLGMRGNLGGIDQIMKLLQQILGGGSPGSNQGALTSFNPFQGSSQFFPEMNQARFNRGIQGGSTIMGPDPQDGVWTPPAGSNITMNDVMGRGNGFQAIGAGNAQFQTLQQGVLQQGIGSPSFQAGPVNLQVEGQRLDSTIEVVGNKAQSLMDQAQALAASDNPADQMKAQRMMQQAQRMIEFMSNMIKIIGDMQKNAIQNMR